ncbi:MAG TPA: LPS export ABC transporter ATP-binding protein [Gammaproteobacteria bacterium]|nr:LPS export ABC transporter ATP-binding protein [Gammaproteobacteria bacterium]
MKRLAAENLHKRFRGREVVKGLSLHVEAGEVVGLLGPNGAGKTTCFYMILGLIRCDAGRITLDERDLTALPVHQRARAGLGYLPQEASIFRHLSARDNVLAVLELNQTKVKRRDRGQRADELLEALGVQHLADTRGDSLSGGERRRVEIARALASDPTFMLLDEPFAGVDPISVVDIQRIVSHLNERGIGVLVTDHNVRETLGICKRAYIVNEGAILAEGKPRDLLADAATREIYLGEDFHL